MTGAALRALFDSALVQCIDQVGAIGDEMRQGDRVRPMHLGQAGWMLGRQGGEDRLDRAMFFGVAHIRRHCALG